MSTKKISCANKQNRWIIAGCLRRELLECLPAAGALRHGWGLRSFSCSLPWVWSNLPPDPGNCLRIISPGCGLLACAGSMLKHLGMFPPFTSWTHPQASSPTCFVGREHMASSSLASWLSPHPFPTKSRDPSTNTAHVPFQQSISKCFPDRRGGEEEGKKQLTD